MDQRHFKELMESSRITGKENLSSLQEMTREYPYFQTAHLLLAKAYHDQEHVRYDRQLKLAAAYAGDRKTLFELIHRTSAPAQKLFTPVEDISSPFILDEKSKTEASPVTSVTTEPVTTDIHPFIESPVSIPEIEQETQAKNSAEEFNKEVLNLVQSASREEESFASGFNEELEPESETTASNPAPFEDPREVLKRRLTEILGGTNEPSVPEKKAEASEIRKEETPVISVPEIPVPEVKSTVEIINENRVSTETEIPHLPEETKLNEPVKDSAEIILQESHKPLDIIEKTELEHALEETLLHSLEKLPVIEKEVASNFPDEKKSTEETEPENINPRSFTDWLKSRRNANFGFVEEVHAEDNRILPVNSDVEIHHQVNKPDAETASEETENASLPVDSSSKSALIDRFIATEPRIVPSKAEFYSPVSQAKKSVAEHEDLVSETLARIYLQQGNYQKARWSYEKLSLLHPEKSSYFAALVKEIDEQFNNLNKEDL